MNYFSIEYLVFYVFLGITALMGSWGSSVRSFREYMSSDKGWGTGALAMSLLATNIAGGVIFSYPNAVYTVGLAAIVNQILVSIVGTYLITIFLIAPRIVHFQNCNTAGDLAEVFFGKKGRILMGISSLYYCACACAIQFMGLKYMADFLGFDSSWGLALMIVLLAIYTARGGMRAVTATDMLHFVAAFGIFPLVAQVMLHQAGGFQSVVKALNPSQLSLFAPHAAPTGRGVIAGTVMSLFPTFTLGFPFVHRLLLTKHQGQSVNMYASALAPFAGFAAMMALVGLSAITLYPETDAQYIVLRFAEGLPPAIKGFIWAAIAGIVLSTAASFLHIAGISLVQDIIQPLADRGKIRFHRLRAVQYSTLLIALLGFSLCVMAAESPTVLVYGMNFMAFLYMIPLLSGIIGLKTAWREFAVATLATAVTFLFAAIVLQNMDLAQIGGLIVNITSYLGTHYYYNRGFAVANPRRYRQTTLVWHPRWQKTRGQELTLSIEPDGRGGSPHSIYKVKMSGSEHL